MRRYRVPVVMVVKKPAIDFVAAHFRLNRFDVRHGALLPQMILKSKLLDELFARYSHDGNALRAALFARHNSNSRHLHVQTLSQQATQRFVRTIF
jgi:hypothetical protein